MSNLPEITDLFSKLASEIETRNSTARIEDQSNDLLISSLNKSLNLSENFRVTILDTALSLMCFTAPQVFDSVIDYSVKTIVSVLSSSVGCKVLRFGKDEVFRVCASISSHDCVEVIEACAEVLGKLVEHEFCSVEGTLSCSLLYAVVRVAVSATRFQHSLRLIPLLYVQSTEGRSPALSKLLYHFPKEISLLSQELPLRLLFWYLDPHTLMHDVSEMLQDAIRRPFLCLNVELYERMEWRFIIIYLAFSPVMFIETRALLHNWFLVTGLASVLELQVELASMVLDVVSRPMWWGVSAEVGLRLPFSHAYFPYKHHFFKTLAGPLSCGGFLPLVHSINKSISTTRNFSHPSVCQAATRIAMVDQKSIWAMTMNFPDWFNVASVLLFFENGFQDSFTSGAAESEKSQAPSCSAAAAWYIAWILNPISESHQEQLTNYLNKLSGSLFVNHSVSNKQNEAASAYKKKLKKPKLTDKEANTSLKEYSCRTIRLWLEEFQDMYIRYYNRSVQSPTSYEVKTSKGIGIHHNVMFRRIPLGILIGSTIFINEDGCELLLHYAATGTILQSTESQHAISKDRRWNSAWQADHNKWTDNCSRKGAVSGACVVFRVTDVAVRMSASMFQTREIGVHFICRLKSRVVKYLVKCVNRLLHLEIDQDDDGLLILKDLYNRMLRWKDQGKDAFQGYKDLDDAIDTINSKLSSL